MGRFLLNSIFGSNNVKRQNIISKRKVTKQCKQIRKINRHLSVTYLLKSNVVRELNHGSGVCKEPYYVPKSSILLAGAGVWKISSVVYGFSSIKIDYSDYLKV